MKLTLKVFGFEIASLTVDSEHGANQLSIVDRGVKGMSNWWTRRMTK